jgi:serine/threonine-protein kinase
MSFISTGSIIDGKYRVEHQLGEGGMGVVFAAEHLQLSQPVAIKFLLPSAAESPEIVERFLREARAAVRIESDHVVRILDVGTLETGTPYIVMERLEGTDLADLIAREGPMETRAAIDAVLQACEALAEAHALGIVHRDLKPANLFRVARRDGSTSIKVLDFGISSVAAVRIAGARTAARLTENGSVMGTVLYMSPEQLRTPMDVDPRSDIWSLGVVLHELLTAEAPFDGSSLPEVTLKIALDAPPSVRVSRPDLTPDIAAIIVRCLEKSRDDRFANVAELASALAPFANRGAQTLVDGASHLLGVDASASRPPSLLPSPYAQRSTRAHVAGETVFGTAADRRRTADERANTAFAARSRGRQGVILATLMIVAALLGIGVVSTHRAPSPTPSARAVAAPRALEVVASASIPTSALPHDSAPSPARSVVAPIASASLAPPIAHATTAPSANNAHLQPVVAAPVAIPSQQPSALPTDSVSPECFPPYTLDDAGVRTPKPACQ